MIYQNRNSKQKFDPFYNIATRELNLSAGMVDRESLSFSGIISRVCSNHSLGKGDIV